MSRRRRTLLLATLALAVPLPAFGLSGGEAAPEPTVADLAVSAELDSCGLMKTQIVCQFSVSYASLPNATSYTASITAPDGSVTDYGSVPAGGTTLTVPYSGNGTYGVRVTAYGVPEEEPQGDEQVIATDEAQSVSDAPAEPRVAPKENPVKATVTPRQPPAPESDQSEVRVTPEPQPSCTEQPPVDPAQDPSAADATATPDAAAAQAQPAPDAATADGADPGADPATAPADQQSADAAAAQPPADPAAAPEPGACPAP
jgi:hypothetical protein